MIIDKFIDYHNYLKSYKKIQFNDIYIFQPYEKSFFLK